MTFLIFYFTDGAGSLIFREKLRIHGFPYVLVQSFAFFGHWEFTWFFGTIMWVFWTLWEFTWLGTWEFAKETTRGGHAKMDRTEKTVHCQHRFSASCGHDGKICCLPCNLTPFFFVGKGNFCQDVVVDT